MPPPRHDTSYACRFHFLIKSSLICFSTRRAWYATFPLPADATQLSKPWRWWAAKYATGDAFPTTRWFPTSKLSVPATWWVPTSADGSRWTEPWTASWIRSTTTRDGRTRSGTAMTRCFRGLLRSVGTRAASVGDRHISLLRSNSVWRCWLHRMIDTTAESCKGEILDTKVGDFCIIAIRMRGKVFKFPRSFCGLSTIGVASSYTLLYYSRLPPAQDSPLIALTFLFNQQCIVPPFHQLNLLTLLMIHTTRPIQEHMLARTQSPQHIPPQHDRWITATVSHFCTYSLLFQTYIGSPFS